MLPASGELGHAAAGGHGAGKCWLHVIEAVVQCVYTRVVPGE